MKKNINEIVVRALHTLQGEGLHSYSFFIKGSQIATIADISRIERDEKEELKGFQRPEIKAHVKSIIDYLDQSNVLFPNAVILAISPEVKFSYGLRNLNKGDALLSSIRDVTGNFVYFTIHIEN